MATKAQEWDSLFQGETFCFGLQVEICGPPDGIFRGTEYYVTGLLEKNNIKTIMAILYSHSIGNQP